MEELDLKKALKRKIPEILENSWNDLCEDLEDKYDYYTSYNSQAYARDKLHKEFTEKYHPVFKEKFKDNGIHNLDYCLRYTIKDYLNKEFIDYEFLDVNEANAFLKRELEEFEIDYELNIYLERRWNDCCDEGYNHKVTYNINLISYNKEKILKEYQEIFKNCFSLFEKDKYKRFYKKQQGE